MRLLKAALVFAMMIGASTADAQVRPEIYDLTAGQIASYRRGVEVMKSRDTAPRQSADFRRSWAFWTNVHGHFGDDCFGPPSGAGMTGIAAWTQTTLAEREIWCTCEHGSDLFLTWHRIALFSFEQVLREASGEPGLMVPYWNSLENPMLPPAWTARTYRNAAGARVPNPLFVANRAPAVNDRTAGIASVIANASNAMAATDFTTFSRRLETSAHGGVHCALVGGCPAGYMGRNASAAADPIFWPHHANVDRIYDVALSLGLPLPTDAGHLSSIFIFVSDAGARSPVVVRDMLTSAQSGVSYAPGPVTAAVETEPPTATLWRTQAARENLRTPQAAQVGERPTLRISGVEVNPERPGTYEVIALSPDGKRSSLGVMAFFAAEHHASPDFDFDLGEAIAALGLRPGDPVEIVLEEIDGLTRAEGAASSVSPGANAAVSNLTTSGSGLTFDRMEIVTE